MLTYGNKTYEYKDGGNPHLDSKKDSYASSETFYLLTNFGL